jgi:hypothetical protein
LVADKNEILWAADTSKASNIYELKAASAIATSGTRLTIDPHTQTIIAVPANTTETAEIEISKISGSFTYINTAASTIETTIGLGDNVFPQQTVDGPQPVVTTQNAETLFTFRAETTFQQRKSATTLTKNQISTTTAAAYQNGTSFRTSRSRLTTATELVNVPTAETSTAGTSDSGRTISKASTVIAPVYHTVLTSFGQPQQSLEAVSGVVDSNGQIAMYYAADADSAYLFGAQNLYAPVSRNVSSVFPMQETLFLNVTGPYTNATFSELKATLSFASETKTSSTTLDIRVSGSGLLVHESPQEWRSAIDPSGLGQKETIYVSLPSGVYSAGSATWSTTGATTSFKYGDTQSSAAPLSLSYVVPRPAFVTGNGRQIYWTAPRNSHSSLSQLTSAGAYSMA